MTIKKIPIGISSCLLGEQVRYDGAHKKQSYITGTLSEYFEFHPVCPEMGIGLGVPRSPLHLVEKEGDIRCIDINNSAVDVTHRLRNFANDTNHLLAKLCGYILKKDSPSCGMERVKVYNKSVPIRKGMGIYARQMMANNPLLPVEEEGRLGDARLRENFIQRVYVLYRWKSMLEKGLSIQWLTKFHAQHKLIIMSRGDYQELGRLLANVTNNELAVVADQYILQLMKMLKNLATRKKHVNVLQHIQGYLKTNLNKDDKAELCEIIDNYRNGTVPLIVPLTLLKHHFRKCPEPYIDNSYYMSPYPAELQLTNEL